MVAVCLCGRSAGGVAGNDPLPAHRSDRSQHCSDGGLLSHSDCKLLLTILLSVCGWICIAVAHGQDLQICARTCAAQIALSRIYQVTSTVEKLPRGLSTKFEPALRNLKEQLRERYALLQQVKFAQSSKRHPALRQAWRQHVLAGALGVTCFALEDVAMRHKIGVVHAVWHCLACLSLAKVEPMLQNLPEFEQKQPEICQVK